MEDMAGFLTLILNGRYGRFLNFDIEMEDMAGLTLILKWKICRFLN